MDGGNGDGVRSPFGCLSLPPFLHSFVWSVAQVTLVASNGGGGGGGGGGREEEREGSWRIFLLLGE